MLRDGWEVFKNVNFKVPLSQFFGWKSQILGFLDDIVCTDCICKTASLSRSRYSSQVPQPTFGSGLGLHCAYTMVISLWGLLVPKFVLESPKMLFYWIAPCIRKPQAEFQKFSSTHVSPSDWFISSSWSPLLVGIKDEEYLSIWSLYFSVHVSFHFFVDDLPWPCRYVGISITALWSLADLYSGWKGIFWIKNGTFCFNLLAKISIIIQ